MMQTDKTKKPASGPQTPAQMRLKAVQAVRRGQLVYQVADAYGVSQRTLLRWLANYSKSGQGALENKPLPGRPSKIQQPQMQWVADTVRQNTPLQFGFDSALWTLAIIGALIQRQFSQTLSSGTLSRIMRLLGFTPQKPLYQACHQNPALVRQWEQEEYPAIRTRAQEANATIFFADEAGMRSDYHSGTTWAPIGQTPVLEATGRRFSINMLSAVSPSGDFRFMLNEGSTDAHVFCEFLKRLMAGRESPVYVIVDGHSIHKAKSVREFVEAQKGMLELFYLPPYSPHLNPDETVWAHAKRQVSRQLVQTKDDMKSLILGALRRIQKLPNLVRSFFKQPECQYILGDIVF